MKPLPICVLYSSNASFVQRFQDYLNTIVTLRVVQDLVQLGRLLRKDGTTLVLIDLAGCEGLSVVERIQTSWPHALIIAWGTRESQLLLDAGRTGIYAIEDIHAGSNQVQRLIHRALEHLRLIQENLLLRERDRTERSGPEVRSSGVQAPPQSIPLRPFTQAFRHFEDVDALLQHVVENIATTLMVSRAGIYSRMRDSEHYRLKAGFKCLESTKASDFSSSDPLLSWFKVNTHLVSRSTLQHIQDPAEQWLLRQTLDALGAEVIIPMHAHGEILGWIFVGQRSTGIPFDYGDFEELLIAADHVSTTLEKALLLEEVQLQKTLAETALQAIPTGLVVVDQEGVIRRLNRAAEQILDVPAPQVLAMPIVTLGNRFAELLRYIPNATSKGSPSRWKDPKTQRSLAVEARKLIAKDDCLGTLVLIRDITLEDQLKEKEEQLDRATFWAELAASMSHEVRNPLVAIKTFAHLLPERYADAEFREEFSALVSKEVDRLNLIVDQLNDFAHPLELECKPMDIRMAIRKGIELAKRKLPQNDIKIEVTAPAELPLMLGDKAALAECFAHILTNAMEASFQRQAPSIGVVSESMESESGDKRIVVSIADHAGGIPPKIQTKVFSPFCTTKAKGMGLGLPIVKRTVADHSGHLEIHTTHQGTTVVLAFPPADEPTDQAS